MRSTSECVHSQLTGASFSKKGERERERKQNYGLFVEKHTVQTYLNQTSLHTSLNQTVGADTTKRERERERASQE